MMDATFGQYHHGNSLVHRLDPRTKLLALAFLIIAVSIASGILGFLFIALYLAIVIFLSRLSFRLILRGIRPMWWLIISIMILHVFFNNRESNFTLFPKNLDDLWKGLSSGILVGCQFALIIIGAVILTLTTIPIRLADALASLFNPFRKIGIPIHQLPIMMLIVLHFVPILFAEAEKLISVRKSRGAGIKKQSIFKKLRDLTPILAPLLKDSFRKADELAIGMESRGYKGGARSQLYPLEFNKSDVVSLIASIGMIAIIIGINDLC